MGIPFYAWLRRCEAGGAGEAGQGEVRTAATCVAQPLAQSIRRCRSPGAGVFSYLALALTLCMGGRTHPEPPLLTRGAGWRAPRTVAGPSPSPSHPVSCPFPLAGKPWSRSGLSLGRAGKTAPGQARGASHYMEMDICSLVPMAQRHTRIL